MAGTVLGTVPSGTTPSQGRGRLVPAKLCDRESRDEAVPAPFFHTAWSLSVPTTNPPRPGCHGIRVTGSTLRGILTK